MEPSTRTGRCEAHFAFCGTSSEPPPSRGFQSPGSFPPRFHLQLVSTPSSHITGGQTIGKSLKLRGWNMWGACRKITQAITPLLSQQDIRGQAGQQRPSSLGLVFDGSPGGRSTGWVLDKGLEGAEMEAAVPVRLWVWGKYRFGWSGLDETKRRWE